MNALLPRRLEPAAPPTVEPEEPHVWVPAQEPLEPAAPLLHRLADDRAAVADGRHFDRRVAAEPVPRSLLLEETGKERGAGPARQEGGAGREPGAAAEESYLDPFPRR